MEFKFLRLYRDKIEEGVDIVLVDSMKKVFNWYVVFLILFLKDCFCINMVILFIYDFIICCYSI